MHFMLRYSKQTFATQFVCCPLSLPGGFLSFWTFAMSSASSSGSSL